MRETRLKRIARWALAILFSLAGVNHFIDPAMYVALIPPGLPYPLFLVYASGVAEIGFGLALLIPRWSRWAAWGVFATLIAVYPANIYHAVSGGLSHPDLSAKFASATLAWIRLPLQFVLLAWAWWLTRTPTTDDR